MDGKGTAVAELTREEIYEYLDHGPRWCRLATLGRDGYPHVVPLGYFRLGEDIVVNMRGQRAANVARHPKVSLTIDEGEEMSELKGVVITGDATIVEDQEGRLELTRAAARARGVAEDQLPTEPREGRTFIRIRPRKFASWDNTRR